MFTPSSTLWQKIDALLDEVLELPAEQRLPYVEAACAGNPALRREMIALIKTEEAPARFLDTPVFAFASTLVGNLIDEQDGLKNPGVDDYIIDQKIGSGGMGVVYRARHQVLDRVVALKVMRDTSNESDMLSRFQLEQRVLSKLNHPNIARLYDLGLTESGKPYFAMEYVEGTHLHDYCDVQELSIEDRLHKFISIAKAIDYAHRNLVIHRDLKPSNIIASKEGEAKLLDFGIAKLLAEEDASEPLTQTGERIMTPKYAAPEQVLGKPVTTATDVYQLGLVLYELLTGHLPYPTAGRSRYEIETAVCKQEPARPSDKINDTEETESGTLSPEKIGQARGDHPEKLSKKLRGDLDAIVLKALRKEPDARYSSADAFVEDIKRYLAGLAVEAHKGNFLYKANKFIKRHTLSVSLVALLLISLLVSSAIMFNQFKETAVQANRSEQALAFVENLFYQISPEVLNNDSLTVRDIAEISRRELSSYEGPALDKASLLTRFGRIHFNLGFYGESESLHNEAYRIRQSLLKQQHPEISESAFNLAYSKFYLRDFEESMALAAAAYNSRIRNSSHEDSLVIESLDLYAYNFYNAGDLETADSLLEIGFAACTKISNPLPKACINLHSSYSVVRETLGDIESAESLLKQAIVLSSSRNANTLDTANLQKDLGIFYAQQLRFDESIQEIKQSASIYRSVLGPSSNSLAEAYYMLGRNYEKTGDLTRAKDFFSMSIDTFDSTPVEVAQEAYPRISLAKIIRDEGMIDAAEELIRTAINIYIEDGEALETSDRIAVAHNELAITLAAKKQVKEAIKYYELSYPILKLHYKDRASKVLKELERLQSFSS